MATAKKAAPKKSAATTAKSAPTKAATKSSSTTKKDAPKRKPNAAFMAPLNVSDEMGAIVGNKPIPRTEIVKKMWDYIKANGLQDAKNKRMINTDDKLKKVFDGKKQVSMFELAKAVNNHVKK